MSTPQITQAAARHLGQLLLPLLAALALVVGSMTYLTGPSANAAGANTDDPCATDTAGDECQDDGDAVEDPSNPVIVAEWSCATGTVTITSDQAISNYYWDGDTGTKVEGITVSTLTLDFTGHDSITVKSATTTQTFTHRCDDGGDTGGDSGTTDGGTTEGDGGTTGGDTTDGDTGGETDGDTGGTTGDDTDAGPAEPGVAVMSASFDCASRTVTITSDHDISFYYWDGDTGTKVEGITVSTLTLDFTGHDSITVKSATTTETFTSGCDDGGTTGGDTTGGETDGDTDGTTGGDTDGDTDGETDGDTDGTTGGDTDGQTDGGTDSDVGATTSGQTDGETDGGTDGATDGGTDSDVGATTSGQTDGDTDGAPACTGEMTITVVDVDGTVVPGAALELDGEQVDYGPTGDVDCGTHTVTMTETPEDHDAVSPTTVTVDVEDGEIEPVVFIVAPTDVAGIDVECAGDLQVRVVVVGTGTTVPDAVVTVSDQSMTLPAGTVTIPDVACGPIATTLQSVPTGFTPLEPTAQTATITNDQLTTITYEVSQVLGLMVDRPASPSASDQPANPAPSDQGAASLPRTGSSAGMLLGLAAAASTWGGIFLHGGGVLGRRRRDPAA